MPEKPKINPITGRPYKITTSEVVTVSATATEILEAPPKLVILEPVIVQSESVQSAKLVEVIAERVAAIENQDADDEVEEGWTKIQLDSQELTAYMSCPQRYEYVFERNLEYIEGVGKPVRKGGIYHQALNAYWKERISTGDYQVATRAGISLAKELYEKEIIFSREERLEGLSNLLEFLRFIQGWNGIPLETEKYFNVLAFVDEKAKLKIFLNGRIDLIAKLPQLAKLPIDFKTESERWFHSQLNNQYRIYCVACEVNLLGVQRIGSQTSLEVKDKFKLELLPFDQDVLDEFRTIQLPYWIRRMLESNETKFFPMNTTDCVHGHFKCQFSDAYNGGICNVSRSVREQKIARYFKVGESWDPANIP